MSITTSHLAFGVFLHSGSVWNLHRGGQGSWFDRAFSLSRRGTLNLPGYILKLRRKRAPANDFRCVSCSPYVHTFVPMIPVTQLQCASSASKTIPAKVRTSMCSGLSFTLSQPLPSYPRCPFSRSSLIVTTYVHHSAIARLTAIHSDGSDSPRTMTGHSYIDNNDTTGSASDQGSSLPNASTVFLHLIPVMVSPLRSSELNSDDGRGTKLNKTWQSTIMHGIIRL